jgi:hypothetical protein
MATSATVNRVLIQALIAAQPPAVVNRVLIQVLIGPAPPPGGWGVGYVRMGAN